MSRRTAICKQIEGSKSIRVTGERQCDFFMLEFENTCAPGADIVMGTGLSNIKAVAEKYSGAMTMEKDATVFRLNVLLNISRHSENVSRHFLECPFEKH